MSKFIQIVVGVFVSMILCGITPDNFNLYLCLLVFVGTFTLSKWINSYLNEDQNYQKNKKEKQSKIFDIIYIIVALVITLTFSCYFKTVLTPIVQESVKIECAKYTADALLENRDKMAKDIEKDIKEKFALNYIDLTATAIEDLSFSDEYEKAVEQKQVALQDKLKAEQVAEKRKVEADADAYVEVAKAKAEAEANELKNKTISDNLIRYETIQKWNGQLPQVEGGNTPIISLK